MGSEMCIRDSPGALLPEISLHALRHGWATVALEAGVPMKVVQDRLNHASERITADIYTHVRALTSGAIASEPIPPGGIGNIISVAMLAIAIAGGLGICRLDTQQLAG